MFAPTTSKFHLFAIAFVLLSNPALNGTEARQDHAQLWADYAPDLAESTISRGPTSTFFLPGHQFESKTEAVRRRCEKFATALLQLAQAQLSEDPALAYQLLHEAAYYGQDSLADRIVNGKTVPIKSKLASSSHPRLKWKRRSYYRISSAHYQVVARDEKAGQEIVERLEALYAIWRQLFFECWSDRYELTAALRRKKMLVPRSSRLHRVVLFNDQTEYADFLKHVQPRIGITRGYYDAVSRTSYFYGSEGSNESTQLHEATHQLFQELQKASKRLPLNTNFWALEGVAMYMESFQRSGPTVTLGGFGSRRLQFARYRRLQEDFYVPLSDLVAIGRDAFQRDERIRKLYSQSAGLAHFLIDGDQQRYRSGFIRYLKSIYDGRDRRDLLTASLGSPATDLDLRYQEFLNVDDSNLQQSRIPADSLKSLCLGKTKVTNEGLMHMNPQRSLEWLDLAWLPVDRGGLSFIRDTRTLQQASFDQCDRVGDKVMEWLSQNPNLDELDLTGTIVTDAGLRHFAGHHRLETLWIGNTRISDASVPILLGLPALTKIQCTGSAITEVGLQQIRTKRPDLSIE